MSAVAVLLTFVVANAEEGPSQLLDSIGELQQTLDLLITPRYEPETTTPVPDVRILATGAQWQWSFQLIGEEGRPVGEAAEARLVVPVDRVVQIDVTSTDVIHELSVPAFAIKIDGIPGRVGTAWFKPTRTGIYFGQCSLVCGSGFSDMVFAIEVVSNEAYVAWLAGKPR